MEDLMVSATELA
jgi:hypothetical protein